MAPLTEITLVLVDGTDDQISRIITLKDNQKMLVQRSSEDMSKNLPSTYSNLNLNNGAVSRVHASLSSKPKHLSLPPISSILSSNPRPLHTVYLTDEQSRHGTYVNDTRLKENVEHELFDGDIVKFGVDIDRPKDLSFKAPQYVVSMKQLDDSNSSARYISYSVPDELDSLSDSEASGSCSEEGSISDHCDTTAQPIVPVIDLTKQDIHTTSHNAIESHSLFGDSVKYGTALSPAPLANTALLHSDVLYYHSPENDAAPPPVSEPDSVFSSQSLSHRFPSPMALSVQPVAQHYGLQDGSPVSYVEPLTRAIITHIPPLKTSRPSLSSSPPIFGGSKKRKHDEVEDVEQPHSEDDEEPQSEDDESHEPASSSVDASDGPPTPTDEQAAQRPESFAAQTASMDEVEIVGADTAVSPAVGAAVETSERPAKRSRLGMAALSIGMFLAGSTTTFAALAYLPDIA